MRPDIDSNNTILVKIPIIRDTTLPTHLTLALRVMTGKNMPLRLKSLKMPRTFTPFTVNTIWGMDRSIAHPTMSPFWKCTVPGRTCLGLPPAITDAYYVDILVSIA